MDRGFMNIGKDDFASLIRGSDRIITMNYNDALKHLKINSTGLVTLCVLDENKGKSISYTSGVLRMCRTTLSRNLRALQRKGYVKVEWNAADRRARVADITPKGKAVIVAGKVILAELERDVFEKLDRMGLSSLPDMLSRFLVNGDMKPHKNQWGENKERKKGR